MITRSSCFSFLILLSLCFIATPSWCQDTATLPNHWLPKESVVHTSLSLVKVDRYLPLKKSNQVLLRNGYASSTFVNAENWKSSTNSRITAIDLVFTAYPVHPDDWLTNYQTLMSKRWQTLFELDSLFDSPGIEYRLVLQTDCPDEATAQSLFHGFVIHLKPTEPLVNTLASIALEDTSIADSSGGATKEEVPSPSIQLQPADSSAPVIEILEFVEEHGGQPDSVVMLALDQLQNVGPLVTVCDWTGSMYGHSANSVLWHLLNPGVSNIQHFAFFNDGNRKKGAQKKPGKTGGVYFQDAQSLKQVVSLFNRVISRGQGGDSPENDLEAVLSSLQRLPSCAGVVLIADNRSCIRDFSLLAQINRPVYVILCGTNKGINPQYIQVARRTGGSLFLLEHGRWLDPSIPNVVVTNDSLLTATELPSEGLQQEMHYALVHPCQRIRVSATKKLKWYQRKKKRKGKPKAMRRRKLFTLQF